MKSSPQDMCQDPANAAGAPTSASRCNLPVAIEHRTSRSAYATVREWAEMIKLEHTVFALPFALSGLLLSTAQLPTMRTLGWTVLAFTGARAAAMTLNRIIDAQIDARNPRTSSRALPTGRINTAAACLFVVASFGLMLLAASQLPPLCLWLSPIAVGWLSFYSYTKRFTWLCHIVLGISLGGAALGGWVAAGGLLNTAAPWLLAFAVSAWVAGFDIIYACQDIDVDRRENLFSMPAKFGVRQALNVSRLLHLITSVCLVLLGCVLCLGPAYWTGAALVMGMLVYEQRLVSEDDLSKIDAAFFTTNGIVSIAAFAAILIDKLMRLGGI